MISNVCFLSVSSRLRAEPVGTWRATTYFVLKVQSFVELLRSLRSWLSSWTRTTSKRDNALHTTTYIQRGSVGPIYRFCRFSSIKCSDSSIRTRVSVPLDRVLTNVISFPFGIWQKKAASLWRNGNSLRSWWRSWRSHWKSDH